MSSEAGSTPTRPEDRPPRSFRVVCFLAGCLSMTAVWIAVDRIGWWSLPVGLLALVPGALAIILGVVG